MNGLIWFGELSLIKCLQIDAAHKVLVGKHKMFVAGGSDANKRFHPIVIGVGSNENQNAYQELFKGLKAFNSTWAPSAVMADGAAYITAAVSTEFPTARRLMCYFHMVCLLIDLTSYIFLL